MAIRLDDSSGNDGWSISRPTPLTRAVRRGTMIDLPGPLRDPSIFDPEEQFTAQVRGARRGGGEGPGAQAAPLRFEADAEDGTPRIAVVRHESGAVTFHLPEESPLPVTRGATRSPRPTVPARLHFAIPVQTAHLPSQSARRGLLSKILNVVIVRVINFVARPVFQTLARKLETSLWKKQGLAEGWLRITDAGLNNGLLEHDTPDVDPDRPALLLIHGTFSNTLAAFRNLLTDRTLADLRARYGDQIYGFDHFTMSKSPDENVAQLLAELGSRSGTFDCISHSRGGLVLRTLLAAKSNQVRIRRAIPVASPNLGTPLATPQRWENTLGWFANLMELFPDNPFTTASAWIANSLSWIAQHATGDLPGLNSMDANGDVVRKLSGTPDAQSARFWHAIASNFTPSDTQLLARLADMGVEQFFQGQNDLVVPTQGGWQFSRTGAPAVQPTQIACFGVDGNLPTAASSIHHLNILAQPEAHDAILKILNGESLGLAPISATADVRRRAVEFAAVAPAADREFSIVTLPEGTPAAPRSPSPEPKGLGFDEEDALNLVVLPMTKSEEPGNQRSAQLLATYGSARVLAPFRLGGQAGGAGRKWQKIIAFQHVLNDFAEGRSDDLTPERLKEGGKELFDVLIQDDVRRLYDQARFQSRRRQLNVIFTSMIPWVADLPWELAYDPSCKSFLSLSDVRFVRNVLTPVPADLILPRPGPLRILVVSSVPRNQQPLSEAEENDAILRSFSALTDLGLAKVEALARATPVKLQERVSSRNVTYDVVHFIGHGEFDETTQTGFLIFEDDRGGSSKIDTDALRSILKGRDIKLVFLNACVSARGSRADYNKGVAPGLVADGVPAVVANQYSVLDASATMFAKHFYGCLVQGLSLGDAMRESRIALNYLVDSGVDWAVPVLFARNPKARLVEARDDLLVNLLDSDELRLPLPASGARPMSVTESFAIEKDARTPILLPPSVSRGRTVEQPRPVERRRIAVWDVADSLPDLDDCLARMNNAQGAFEFRSENLTAPLGTWGQPVKASQGRYAAYLSAERIAKKMKNIVASLGADLLLCVTNLPLRDEETLNIYLWTGPAGDSQGDAPHVPIAIFSTWGFDPPIAGESLASALANVAVQTIAFTVEEAPTKVPKDSISYYNAERDRNRVVGKLTIDRRTRIALKKVLSATEIDALEQLLTIYHPGPEPRKPRLRKPATSKRNKKRPKL